MKVIIQALCSWYGAKNRWWIPLVAGLLFSAPFAPFNHETHPALFFFPLLVFAICAPLFAFSVQQPLKRAILHTYLFSFSASLTQFYWLTNVVAEGLYHLVLTGMIVTAAIVGLFYLAMGMMFRVTRRHFPRLYLVIYPGVWILIEWLRSVGDIAFPWNHLGYAFTPLLPVAQIASVTGVYGLSAVAVLGNILLFEILESYRVSFVIVQKWLHFAVFAVLVSLGALWGGSRLGADSHQQKPLRAAMIQANIDQLHWNNRSMDTTLAVIESLCVEASAEDPDVYVLSESALFCYLERRQHVMDSLFSWVETLSAPIIFGSLHLEKTAAGGYRVYNTAFMADTTNTLDRYYKMRLVPGSEAMPFAGVFPILSRLNLGSADFSRGVEPAVFELGAGVRAGPFICYEIIFPGLVRQRVRHGATVLVNITNDGWFGKSTAPHQHAAMARMRAIENRTPLIRTANSGISMAVDSYGRVLTRTGLYTREAIVASITPGLDPTFYTRHGDWPLRAAVLIVLSAIIGALARRIRRSRANPDNTRQSSGPTRVVRRESTPRGV
jgi:apolipoprotein N-acyltransferase